MIPASREKILEEILKQLHDKFSKLEHPIQKFDEIVMAFKIFQFEFDYNDIYEFCKMNNIKINETLYKDKTKSNFILHLTTFHEMCKYQWRPLEIRNSIPDFKGFNSGVIFNGRSGTGKSQILAYIHAWAKENNWIVLSVPKASSFSKGYSELERHLTGLYLQHNLVREFLVEFKIMNYKLLKSSEVDLYLYGKSDMAGNRDGDPDPVPVLWDKEREVYTDAWKKWIPKVPNFDLANDYPDHHKRLYDLETKPKNLLEIVNLGILYLI
jgi:hypothetical protein